MNLIELLLRETNVVSHVKGRTQTEGGSEQGAYRLRETFGPSRDEVTGGWRKLHNEEQLNKTA
jgi:hypothetical protein